MYRIASRQKTSVKKAVAGKDKEKMCVVALNSDDFLFSQSTIVCSVVLEPDSYKISSDTSKYVNQNGDCWSNESLKANYKSFIGSFNYVNHVQEPEKSVGFIADTVLRRVFLDPEGQRFVYYCDILIATNRGYEDLVKKILTDKIEFMSMGCEAHTTICSKCGKTYSSDDDLLCDCLANSKGKYFIDSDGRRRVVAEILGTAEPGSVEFIEASWLTEVPAFDGAYKRNVLQIPHGTSIEVTLPESALDKEAMKMYLGK